VVVSHNPFLNKLGIENIKIIHTIRL